MKTNKLNLDSTTFYIGDECNHILSVAEHVDEKQHEKEREKNERDDQEIDIVEKLVEVGGLKVEKKAKKDVFVDVDSGESQMAQLAVGSVDNIVAHAKVYGFSRMEDLTLHGEKLDEEYAKVSITEAIKDVDIPVPIPGESNLKTVKKKKALKRLKKANVQDDEECGQEFQVEFGSKYPLQLKRLWLWAKEALSDDRAHPFVLNKDAFGVEKKLSIFLSDIHALCARGEMAGSIITIYIQNHWALTVVKPNEEVVYYMDPLKRRIDSQEWTKVVDNAIVLYKSTMNTPMLKKKVSWENMAIFKLLTFGVVPQPFEVLYLVDNHVFCILIQWSFNNSYNRKTDQERLIKK
ncbi:unnamed protein product [Cuscuta campestris]|uniref:Ubiquitin-like protease family profile domain-containing protein n=1 Tax=Cuscuta campestris TaxID=132261 RepID=A0A484LSW3_9ASTE|nr:unnamed protein product [Cuscuta campestris]